jgi:hypothetical protein
MAPVARRLIDGCRTLEYKRIGIAVFNLHPPPMVLSSGFASIAGDGVCSVNVAWAWKAVGLPVTETSGMIPADIPQQPFVGPVESVIP